jgi:hypothetical protein
MEKQDAAATKERAPTAGICISDGGEAVGVWCGAVLEGRREQGDEVRCRDLWFVRRGRWSLPPPWSMRVVPLRHAIPEGTPRAEVNTDCWGIGQKPYTLETSDLPNL